MSKRFADASDTKSKKRAYLAAFLVGAIAIPGCGIPCLRCAQPGPSLPDRYSDSTNHLFEQVGEAGEVLYWSSNKNAPSGDASGEASGNPSGRANQQVSYQSGGEATSAELSESSEQAASTGKTDSDDALQFASFIETASQADFEDSTESIRQSIRDESGSITVGGLISSDTEMSGEDGSTNALVIEIDGLENSAQLSRYDFFNDPVLTGLIEQALTGNQELRMLSEEIRIASLEVQARSGEYLPFATLGAGAAIEKPGRFTREGAVEEQLEVAPGKGFPEPLPDFLVATNISWELDIWKKLRNAQNAAAYRYLATREGRNYVVTRMVAEIAQSYYELLALDNRLTTLDKTIEIQKQSLDIAQAKKVAGRGTELAVQRFQAEVRKNESEKLIIQQEIVEVENRINFLVGRYPQTIERPSVEYIDLNLHSLRAGVPAQLLQNRPDIRQAERELVAAGLDVKVARARFYPSLSLSAAVGYRAFNTRYLFWSPESLLYNVAGELVGPLINKRAIKADYLSANAEQLKALYHYQRTILNAYTEVINRLAKVDNYGKSIEIKKQQLQSLQASVDSATQLFQNARAEYVEVLLAQREMMEARMLLIETKQEQLSAIVNTYQALGGGGF